MQYGITENDFAGALQSAQQQKISIDQQLQFYSTPEYRLHAISSRFTPADQTINSIKLRCLSDQKTWTSLAPDAKSNKEIQPIFLNSWATAKLWNFDLRNIDEEYKELQAQQEALSGLL